MILKNGYIFADGDFTLSDIKINNGIIEGIGSFSDDENIIDCAGKYILPGLVDIHTHGCMGFDFSTASPGDIKKMLSYYLNNGITSVLPTTVALSDEDIKKAVDNIASVKNDAYTGAQILGINLEGPYLSPKKCGAHDISLLKAPDIDFVNSLGDIIKIVDLAPEYDTSMDFIKKFKGKSSIAHTDCDYDTAVRAINTGADHITHIFNAMNGLHHRNPGVIGAFFDSDAFAEMICDGIHVAPPVLRMMFNFKGEQIAVISDSMSATGLKDGTYTLGKLRVYVKNSVATLEDGTLAGSTMNIYDMMKKLISIGVKPQKAVASVTNIPAVSAGLQNSAGFISAGRKADLVIAYSDFSPDAVIFSGCFLNRN